MISSFQFNPIKFERMIFYVSTLPSSVLSSSSYEVRDGTSRLFSTNTESLSLVTLEFWRLTVNRLVLPGRTIRIVISLKLYLWMQLSFPDGFFSMFFPITLLRSGIMVSSAAVILSQTF